VNRRPPAPPPANGFSALPSPRHRSPHEDAPAALPDSTRGILSRSKRQQADDGERRQRREGTEKQIEKRRGMAFGKVIHSGLHVRTPPFRINPGARRSVPLSLLS